MKKPSSGIGIGAWILAIAVSLYVLAGCIYYLDHHAQRVHRFCGLAPAGFEWVIEMVHWPVDLLVDLF